MLISSFFFTDAATTEIYTLSLHDALPIFTASCATSLCHAGNVPKQGLTLVSGSSYRSEEHTSELQSLRHLVCRLLLEKKKKNNAAGRSYERANTHIYSASAGCESTTKSLR